jgi:NAD(P)-dependent dehydrogenase (short-subunit alcohol dehydrogenase family)
MGEPHVILITGASRGIGKALGGRRLASVLMHLAERTKNAAMAGVAYQQIEALVSVAKLGNS